VHDFFDILGVPTDAAASEVRRACARRIRRAHPDFSDVPAAPAAPVAREAASPVDAAIDFADMRVFVEGMQRAFFNGS